VVPLRYDHQRFAPKPSEQISGGGAVRRVNGDRRIVIGRILLLITSHQSHYSLGKEQAASLASTYRAFENAHLKAAFYFKII
jgi:hypothetical protein